MTQMYLDKIFKTAAYITLHVLPKINNNIFSLAYTFDYKAQMVHQATIGDINPFRKTDEIHEARTRN